MLTKANLAIASVASHGRRCKADSPGSTSFAEDTRVTDGRCTFIVTKADVEQLPLFEESEGVELGEFFTPFLMDRESAIKVSKAIPAKASDKNPAQFGIVDATTENSDRATISVTDAVRQEIVRAKKFEAKYPNLDRLMPDVKKAKLTLRFSSDDLAKAFKAVATFASQAKCVSVDLSFFGPGVVMRVDAKGERQELSGVIMPQSGEEGPATE